jgi:hypothetical protein
MRSKLRQLGGAETPSRKPSERKHLSFHITRST